MDGVSGNPDLDPTAERLIADGLRDRIGGAGRSVEVDVRVGLKVDCGMQLVAASPHQQRAGQIEKGVAWRKRRSQCRNFLSRVCRACKLQVVSCNLNRT